jgi:hypothetical protein
MFDAGNWGRQGLPELKIVPIWGKNFFGEISLTQEIEFEREICQNVESDLLNLLRLSIVALRKMPRRLKFIFGLLCDDLMMKQSNSVQVLSIGSSKTFFFSKLFAKYFKSVTIQYPADAIRPKTLNQIHEKRFGASACDHS